MNRNIKDILPSLTSHGIGKKRILLSKDETTTAITQIAVTQLKADEKIESHNHATMEEYFLFQKGEAILTINNQEIKCTTGDFIQIPARTLHSLQAITDIEILTVGCATNN